MRLAPGDWRVIDAGQYSGDRAIAQSMIPP
jgi:hypothetical protein